MDFLSESLFYTFIIGFIVIISIYFVEGIESLLTLYSQHLKSKKRKKDKNSR